MNRLRGYQGTVRLTLLHKSDMLTELSSISPCSRKDFGSIMIGPSTCQKIRLDICKITTLTEVCLIDTASPFRSPLDR